MPPVGIVAAMVPAFAGLLLLLSVSQTKRGGFTIGWGFAFGFHLFGLSWIGEAFLVDAEKFAWMLPFAVGGLPAGLAIIAGIAGALFVRTRTRHIGRNIVLFSVLFMAAEWMRGHLFTGFPWNLPVQAWSGVDAALQGSAWIGPYGLSFLSVAAFCAPAMALARGSVRYRTLWAVALSCPLLILVGAGALRLASAPAEMPTVGGTLIRLVQPNIAQKEKWQRHLMSRHFNRHLELSKAKSTGRITHIIWPEAATTFLLPENTDAIAQIATVTPKDGVTILGSPRRRILSNSGDYVFHNSIIFIDDAGEIVNIYDKHHLVPFGEYVPARDWLPFQRLAQSHGAFVPGPGPQTVQVPGAPACSPLVCYEAIFPWEVAASSERPGWLLNVTNDAWFGESAGPHQHFAIARMRAIEQGIPLVRAANTGISAIVDPYGRVVASLDVGESGVVDGPLPEALEPTFYARWGEWPFILALVTCLLALLLFRDEEKARPING